MPSPESHHARRRHPNRSQGSLNSHTVILHPFAAKLNLTPRLSSITLAQMLAGDTCSPIGLSEFEKYLTYKEYNVENLQFIIWFQAYQDTYVALYPPSTCAPSPPSSGYTSTGTVFSSSPSSPEISPTLPSIPSPSVIASHGLGLAADKLDYPDHLASFDGETTTRITQPAPLHRDGAKGRERQGSRGSHGVLGSSTVSAASQRYPPTPFSPASATFPTEGQRHYEAVPQRQTPSGPTVIMFSGVTAASELTAGTDSHNLADGVHSAGREAMALKLRHDCLRALATFFYPGSPKELNVHATMREEVIRQVKGSKGAVDPIVFRPAYSEVYSLLEMDVLPRFLTFATANINNPKQIFWYSVGTTDLCLGLVIALALVLTPSVSTRDPVRAWRIFALIPWWFGSMQLYSAWRGFCNQVWGRNAVQLKAWEMEEAKEPDTPPEMSAPGWLSARSRCNNEEEEKQIGSMDNSKCNPNDIAPDSPRNHVVAPSTPHMLTITVPSANTTRQTREAETEGQSSLPARAPWENIELCSPISSDGMYLPYQFRDNDGHEADSGCYSEWPATPTSSAPLRPTFASAQRISFASAQRISFDHSHSPIAPFTFSAITSRSSPSPRAANDQQHRRPGIGTEFAASSSTSLASHRSVHHAALGLPPDMEEGPRPSTGFTAEDGTGDYASSRGSSSFRRPPIFGPEKVVEDERIKEVHARIMRDIWWVGGIAVAIFAAIIFSIPGRGHRHR